MTFFTASYLIRLISTGAFFFDRHTLHGQTCACVCVRVCNLYAHICPLEEKPLPRLVVAAGFLASGFCFLPFMWSEAPRIPGSGDTFTHFLLGTKPLKRRSPDHKTVPTLAATPPRTPRFTCDAATRSNAGSQWLGWSNNPPPKQPQSSVVQSFFHHMVNFQDVV